MSNTPSKFKNPIVRWIDERLPVITMMEHSLVEYRTPKNLNYMWNFGSLAGIVLVIMILTGIFLAMQYTPHVDYAFGSVERIMRDVNYGWLIRYIHMNGASFFFAVVYIHIFRGLYYGSFKQPRELLWIMGVVIFVMMMATAFMGYVLPWGQMSFWGATVITNLFSAIPVVGGSIVEWLWGGFAVDNPTLNRFFALHYLLPFLIIGVVFLHLIALHQFGSSNPTGLEIKDEKKETIPFHPYYTVKDLFGLSVFLLVFCGFVFYAPDYLGHPDNYIPANPMVTPAHIVPEWYFLPFYAILRSITFSIELFGVKLIDSKLLGVIAMFGSIVMLGLLPWIDRSPIKSSRFRPVHKWFFWAFLLNFVLLGILGGKPAEGIYPTIALICTAYYFAHFVVILPLLNVVEPRPNLPDSPSGVKTKKKGKK